MKENLACHVSKQTDEYYLARLLINSETLQVARGIGGIKDNKTKSLSTRSCVSTRQYLLEPYWKTRTR